MRSSGDLTDVQRRQVAELDDFERLVDNDQYANERKAQMYVCMAHDWYQMDMEEEGNRLLMKAERICPGYFVGPMIEHQRENDGFDTVIRNLKFELNRLLASTLRNK